MASTKTQQSMVFLKEGAPAADQLPGCFAGLRQEKVHKSGTPQSARDARDEVDFSGKPNMYPAKEAIMRIGEKCPSSLNTQSDNLPPDSICKGVKVTLDNNSMWSEFFRSRTEMILTKQGSRMFPYCRFRISGMQPHKKYCLIMDIRPLDNNLYKWTGESWQVSRKSECLLNSKPFVHPESPATGQHWMQNPVSFYKLKLTNNISDQEGNIILHPLHRYLPRLHLVETDKATEDIRLKGPNVLTFIFPQTEFMTVTTYQSPQFALLKVKYNPFAKRLKEDGFNSWSLKLKANLSTELNKDGTNAVTEQHPVKKSLKFLLANHKPRCSKGGDSKPPAPKDLQKTSGTNKAQPAAIVPGESPSRNSSPAQKLFSELIREAHVSLQRCQVEQAGTNHSTPLRAEQSNTKTTTLAEGKKQGVGHRDNISVSAPSRKSETIETLRKVKDDKCHFNSTDFKNIPRSSGSGSGDAAPSNDHHPSGTPSENVTQQKRPARLPLPALALFLKQHSTKHKKTNSKLNSPPQAPPPESLSEPTDSAAVRRTTECCGHDRDPHEMDFSVTGQEGAERSSSPFSLGAASDLEETKTDDSLISISESLVPHDTSGMSNSDNSLCTLKVSASTPPTCSTSSESSHLSTAFCVSNSPKAEVECPTLPSDTQAVKTDSLLFDPECSAFDFDPLSPASSSEPLPPFPACLALDIDSTSSVAASVTESAQDPEQCKNSSVFKWHTVLPPSDTYVNSSFTTFQPPQQASSLLSLTPPLLPCHPQSQNLDITADPTPSFQEGEPALPFPAELSPLALQLSLSPTFSSLDEDGLSPTPSLSELVHFFSTDVDIGIGVEFPNTETTAAPCPPPPAAETLESSLLVQPAVSKSCKRKKSSKSKKLSGLDENQNVGDYRSLQPNLDEVEEQLFISFTSKEALKLHVSDSCEDLVPQPQLPPDGQQTSEENASSDSAESLKETIAAFQKTLLKDLEIMKYRQVIHPVLQEVGLKMTLLDPALSIDLQYLGVHLPLPPSGVGVEPPTQTLPSSQGVSAAFHSRTGKTTDVTQIKGWREKFTPPEATPPSLSGPEAGSSSEPQKKNLSAFCSDMLDEYLENEGKLIDERAASFSQPPVEPPVYKLPVSGTSYVRTLDHILKKQTTGPPASDLITGFIPPSKRPRLKEMKPCRRTEKKQKCPKQNKSRAASTLSESSLAAPKQPGALTPGDLPQTIPPPELPIFKKRRRHKPTTSSQTLGPSRPATLLAEVSGDLAPVESDSELGQTTGQTLDACKRESRPTLTRALLRQRDLEDGVVREGRFRTSITDERAGIALTSLFTLTGFVRENPTAPIQLAGRQASPCLNEFCRLGCICSSLSYSSRVSHCGRPPCMFGCSCLKQKVVLLKNLDSSDSSPTAHHSKIKKRRRKKRRMKMAYVLKEADTVTQPAERVRTLWGRNVGDADPDPLHIPDTASSSHPAVSRRFRNSCARVRGYRGKIRKQKEGVKGVRRVRRKAAGLKLLKQKDLTLKETTGQTSRSHSDDGVQGPPPSPPAEPTPKPSKRLIILAECKWASDGDRSYVLKKLCEAMAREQLSQPFWVKKYLISPIDETVEGSGANQCIEYKVQISTPKLEKKNDAVPVKVSTQGSQKNINPAAQHQQNLNLKLVSNVVSEVLIKEMERQKPVEIRQKEAMEKTGPVEDWQREVEDDLEPLELCQKEVIEESEILEDWQKAVEESDPEEERECGSSNEAKDEQKRNAEEIKSDKMKKVAMGLPFLTGVSPAGFLSANRKQPGGTGHPIQVNGKQYPLARIQLGRMGALHPANRLAAYLTGRVRFQRQQEASVSSSLLSSKPQSSTLVPHVVSSASAVPSSLTATTTSPHPSASQLTYTTTSTAPQPKSSPNLFLVSTPPKDPQVLWLQVPAPAPCKTLSQLPQEFPCTSQKMVLQPVQSTSGAQCYRRPDGKLIQLIPVNQLRSVKTKQPVQEGVSSSFSVLSASCPQTPAVTIVKRPALTTLTMSSSSSSSTVHSTVPLSSSSLGSSSSIIAAPLQPPSVFVANQDTRTPTFQTSSFSKSPMIVTLPSPQVVTAPGSLPQLQDLSLPVASFNPKSHNPSFSQGDEKGVKTVAVTTVSDGFTMVVQPQTASPQTQSTPQPPTETLVPKELPPPARSAPLNPSDRLSPEQELACNLVDLDIVCVDEETGLHIKQTQPVEVVDLLSSSETENSSDFRESDSEEEEPLMASSSRHLHNKLEKERRGKLQRKFNDLKKEVVTTRDVSAVTKISTLNKAVELIQELRSTEEALKRMKRRLRRRRDDYLSILAPPAADQTDATRRKGSDPSVKPIEISSDEATLTDTDSCHYEVTGADGLTAAGQLSPRPEEPEQEEAQDGAMERLMEMVDKKMETLNSVNKNQNSPRTLLLTQVPRELLIVSRKMEKPKILTMDRNHKRDTPNKEFCSSSGKKKLQKLLTRQEHPSANDVAAGGGASVVPPTEVSMDDVIAPPSVPQPATQTPPSCVSNTGAAKTPVMLQPVPQVLNSDLVVPSAFNITPQMTNRRKTFPNILSRSKKPVQTSLLNEKSSEDVSKKPVLPAEVVSLVGKALPGLPVLTLNPVIVGTTGVQKASTPGWNVSNLTKQEVPVPSLPRPSTGSTQQQTHPTQRPTTEPTQPEVAPLVAASQLFFNESRNQEEAPSQTLRPASDVVVAPGPGAPQDPDKNNKKVPLNQRTVATATTAAVPSTVEPSFHDPSVRCGVKEQRHASGSQLCQMDSVDPGLTGLPETKPGIGQPGPPFGCTTGGVLAPPPLLHMKMGNASVAGLSRRDGAAMEGGGGGRDSGGVAWRPMPRLVPLGLRENSPS